MKIAVLATDGSPLGITERSIFGKDGKIGVGGSELAIMTLMSEWTKEGKEVVFFNDPRDKDASVFEQRECYKFDPNENWDVVIVFRTPNYVVSQCDCMKVWLSFDQFTSSRFEPFFPMVDKVVGISEYHSNYFKDRYNFHNMIVIDLPVRTSEFVNNNDKIDYKCIYSSVPGRGLNHLLAIWPTIKRDIQNASLTITSDYRLWGVDEPRDDHFRVPWTTQKGVKYIGALTRERYIQELMSSSVLVYPHKEVNCELFCISVAEAQVAGVYPITSSYGALETTNMGTVVDGDPEDQLFRDKFADEVISLLSNRDKLEEMQKGVREKAIQRFCPQTILKQWDEKVFNG